jgi:hypothetical protein
MERHDDIVEKSQSHAITGFQNNVGVTVLPPSFVVHRTPPASVERLTALWNGTHNHVGQCDMVTLVNQ